MQRCEDNFTEILKETEYEGVGWIQLPQGTDV